MKPILVVNPNTSVEMSASIEVGLGQLSCDVLVEVVNVKWGPASVESELDSLLAANSVVETIWANRDKYSGFVVACFDDPGVKAAQEIVEKPIIGIGEAAICQARDYHKKIGVIIVDTRVTDRVSSYFLNHGVDLERVEIVSLDSCVIDLNSEDPDVVGSFIDAGMSLKNQGVDCIVLACAGFSRQRLVLEQTLNLPILDGNSLAVEALFNRTGAVRNGTYLQLPQPFSGLRPVNPPWEALLKSEDLDEGK